MARATTLVEPLAHPGEHRLDVSAYAAQVGARLGVAPLAGPLGLELGGAEHGLHGLLGPRRLLGRLGEQLLGLGAGLLQQLLGLGAGRLLLLAGRGEEVAALLLGVAAQLLGLRLRLGGDPLGLLVGVGAQPGRLGLGLAQPLLGGGGRRGRALLGLAAGPLQQRLGLGSGLAAQPLGLLARLRQQPVGLLALLGDGGPDLGERLVALLLRHLHDDGRLVGGVGHQLVGLLGRLGEAGPGLLDGTRGLLALGQGGVELALRLGAELLGDLLGAAEQKRCAVVFGGGHARPSGFRTVVG